MRSLGIDPGNEGGAVLLEPIEEGWRALAAWYWRPCTRDKRKRWRVVEVRPQPIGPRVVSEQIADTLGMVGRQIQLLAVDRGQPYWLTVEGLWGRGRTLERLSWYAGLVAAAVEASCEGSADDVRPPANVWRRELLGLAPGTPAQVAEDAAVVWAARNVGGLCELSGVGHVAEAAAIAAWRYQWEARR